MPVKISNLPAADPLSGDESMVLVQSDQTVKAPVSALGFIPTLGFVPTGAVMPFAVTLPSGWLRCDGADYAETDYSALAAYLIGTFNTARGAADPGAGRFRVPNLSGLVIGASGGAGAIPTTSLRAAQAVAGEEDHQLTTAELAAHSHEINDSGHTHTPTNSSDVFLTSIGPANVAGVKGAATGKGDSNTSSDATGITIQSEGADDGHNNIQPTIFLVWGIKT